MSSAQKRRAVHSMASHILQLSSRWCTIAFFFSYTISSSQFHNISHNSRPFFISHNFGLGLFTFFGGSLLIQLRPLSLPVHSTAVESDSINLWPKPVVVWLLRGRDFTLYWLGEGCLKWLTCLFLFIMVEFEKLLYSPDLKMITRFSCYESFPQSYVQMSLCFTLTRDPMSRNGRRQSFMSAWVCTAAPHPSEKIAPWQTTYHCPSSWRDSAQLENFASSRL